MSFLSKAWKGIKKVVKKVGKGIKKGIMKVGKFMDKIGIVGQIGLGLIMPGIGSMLGQWAGTISTGFGSGIINAAKAVVNAGINIGQGVGKVFSTVTEGVTNVMGEVAGATVKELGLTDFVKDLGWDVSKKAFSNVGTAASSALDATTTAVGDLFSKSTLTATNKFAQEAATKALASAGVEAPTVESVSNVGTDVTSELSLGTAEKPLFTTPEIKIPDAVGPESAFTPQPSLLDRGIEGIKNLPTKVGEMAVEKIENAPKEIVDYGTKLAKNVATEKAYEAAGIDTTPDNISYRTYVPTIDQAPTVATPPNTSDYSQYFNKIVGSINEKPYGHNALLFNTYAPQRQQRGL